MILSYVWGLVVEKEEEGGLQRMVADGHMLLVQHEQGRVGGRGGRGVGRG